MTPFFDSTSLFSSISNDEDTEWALWEELFGCVEYLKIPYDTILRMPVHVRKFWINRHNQAIKKEKDVKDGYTRTVEGVGVNAFAALEQANQRALLGYNL